MSNPRFTGRKHSAETKRKQSEAHKGKKHSEEHRRKNSEAHKDRKLSEETKRKISESLKRKKYSKENRRKFSEAFVGNKNSNWKGGKEKTSDGYIGILCRTHPHVDVRGYVMEHRLIMESYIGRVLLPTEIVHHINGIRHDNRIENLMLFSSNGQHQKFHNKQRKEE